MSFKIPYGKQHISADDIAAVVETLQSDFLTQGPKISEFETAFAGYIGSKYAVAVNNATAGLHLAVMALSLKPGERVITTPLTFAASANCVRYAGGEVWFSDIDPETLLLDIEKVKELIESKEPGFFKGIIPVDFAGRAVDLEKFRALADLHGLWIIEDACHAPGGYFVDSEQKQQFCGNGSLAELSVFSFHPVKHIACGEGGMVTTNSEELYKKLLLLRSHGITRTAEDYTNSNLFAFGHETESNEYPLWYMEMQELGYNYRLTDFQAALGISQLKRAAEGLKRRREIASIYNDAFKDLPQVLAQSGFVEGHAYHLYVLQVDDRTGLFAHLRNKNIYAQIHYIPLHLMPYYRELGWKEGDFPNTEAYYKDCISIPMFPTLSNEEIQFVISEIKSYYNV